MSLKELKDKLAKEAYGKTREEVWKYGKCLDCGEDALAKCYSDAGRKEYYISGLCELCFDSLFKE